MRHRYPTLIIVAALVACPPATAAILDDEYSNLLALESAIGKFYREGDYEQAEAQARKALALVRSLDDTTPQLVAEHLTNVGRAVRLERRGAEAERLLAEAQQILRAHPPEDQIQYAVLLLNLGWARFLRENDVDAERDHVEALDILKEHLGLANLYAAEAQMGLAAIRWRAGETGEARELFDRAWPLLDEIVGGKHPLALWYRAELARLDVSFGQPEPPSSEPSATDSSARSQAVEQSVTTVERSASRAEAPTPAGKLAPSAQSDATGGGLIGWSVAVVLGVLVCLYAVVTIRDSRGSDARASSGPADPMSDEDTPAVSEGASSQAVESGGRFAIREGVSSLRVYFILVSIYACLMSLAQGATKVRVIVGLAMGVAYFLIGVRLRTLLAKAIWVIYAAFGVVAATLVLGAVAAIGAGAGSAPLIEFLIVTMVLVYLFRNVRRLGRREREQLQNPQSRMPNADPRVLSRVALLAIAAWILSAVVFGLVYMQLSKTSL